MGVDSGAWWAAMGKGAAMLSDLVVCYLFLGGAGAGLCLVSAVLGLLSPRERIAVETSGRSGTAGARLRPTNAYRRLLAPGFAVAFAMLAVGALCLVADLGGPERIALLFLTPRFSFLTVGAWSLAVLLVLAGLLCFAWLGTGPPARSWSLLLVRLLEALAVAVALVVMLYTGLLLQSVAAVPLWATPWVPALFVASSLSCGTAAALGVAQFSGAARAFGSTLCVLVAVDAVVIAIEALVTAVFVASLVAGAGAPETGTDAAVASSMQQLLTGANAWLFWGAFVVAGMAVPLALDLAMLRARLRLPLAVLATMACVLAGGFALRFCIVEAGVHPMLSAAGIA